MAHPSDPMGAETSFPRFQANVLGADLMDQVPSLDHYQPEARGGLATSQRLEELVPLQEDPCAGTRTWCPLLTI